MDWSTFWGAIGGFTSLVSLLLTYHQNYRDFDPALRFVLIIAAALALWTAIVTARRDKHLRAGRFSRRRVLPARPPILKRFVNAVLDAIIDMLIGALIVLLIMTLIIWSGVLLSDMML